MDTETLAKGLCHKCLGTNLEVRHVEGKGVVCQNCENSKYPRNTSENQPPPTAEDLKKAWEKNW